MRILYVLNTLAIGGAERLVVSLADRMLMRGHKVSILTLLGSSAGQLHSGADVIRLNMNRSPLNALRGYARAVRAVHAFRPDIVHSHNFQGNMLARGVRLALPGIPIISTVHNEYEGGGVRMFFLRLTDSLSTRTVAVCHAVAERALQLGVVPARKLSVIQNGIDVSQFMPDPARHRAMRNALGAGEDFVWLTAGRVTPAKDYLNLLRAFAQVRRMVPDTQLWIAGDGDGDYAEAMRISAVEAGLGGTVQWLGMRRDVAALLDAADGFVLASAWEGMPLALAEAMAMAKPIAATGVGGVSELVYKCGLIVPPRDADALARAMLSLVHTPPEAREYLGGAARQRVIDDFDIDKKADAWEALYRETANGIWAN